MSPVSIARLRAALGQSWPAPLAGLLALALYARTLAPGLTWAHHGADGGDLLAAALTGGVPHPTGYPTYQLVLRTAIALFPGDPARAGNWLSALAAACAVAVLTDLARRVLALGGGQGQNWHGLIALTAGLSWAASPLLWSQAVITEVYTLHALAVVVILWLLWRWREAAVARRPAHGWLVAAGLTWGLGLGNHVSLALMAPAVVVWIRGGHHGKAASFDSGQLPSAQDAVPASEQMSMPQSAPQRMKTDGRRSLGRSLPMGLRCGVPGQAPASGRSGRRSLLRSAPVTDRGGRRTLVRNSRQFNVLRLIRQMQPWTMLFAGLALGLSVYIYLPLAAARGPAINWGDPSTPAGFWWTISGRAYATLFLGLAPGDLLARIAAWAGMAAGQLGGGPWGLLLALAGLWWTDRHQHRWWQTTGLIALAYTAYSLAYRTTDSYVYLLPAWTMTALWLAAGLGWLIINTHLPGTSGVPGKWGAILGIAFLLCMLLPTGGVLAGWAANDLSHDTEARDFVSAALAEAEPDALVLTGGDRTTFALWYAVYGLGQRRDIVPLNVHLYEFEWYRMTLHRHHPELAQIGDTCTTATPLGLLVEQALAAGRPVYRAEPIDLILPAAREAPTGVLVRIRPDS